jgi:hypothetical protein
VIRANLGEQTIDVLELGNVGALCNRTVADLLHRRSQCVRVTPGMITRAPLQRECLCRREPDTAVAANDDDNLPLKALSQEIPPRHGPSWARVALIMKTGQAGLQTRASASIGATSLSPAESANQHE